MTRPRLALILVAFVAFISLGLPDAVLGVAWPSVRRTFGLPVSQVDERYTSTDAASLLHDAGLDGRQAKQHLDSVAAQLILQGYFDVATDS